MKLDGWKRGTLLEGWDGGHTIQSHKKNDKLQIVSVVMFLLGFYSTGNVMVGPPHVKVPKPLPPDLEEFVSNSGGHGFIIVSFGSNVASNLDKTVVDMLATAFGKLKQRVVWRIKGNSRVKLRNYLP